MHLGAWQVGEHWHVVLAQRPRGDDAGRIDQDLFEQRRAERLRHPALDLAAQLHRVDHRAGVHGLHRLQDADLTCVGADRDTESLDGERGRPGQPVAVPLRLEQLPVGPLAVGALTVGPLAGGPRRQRLGQRPRRPQRGGARDHEAGGPVRAGVVP